jgi:hypothetical protein
MTHKIDICETDKKFTLASSLLDIPYTDENSMVRISIFYLGQNGKPGGDTFKVKVDAEIAVSLLGDLSEEGERARRCLTPLMADLEKMVEASSSYSLNSQEIASTILSMEKKLHFPIALALSFVRVTRSRKMHYLNIGENILLAKYGTERVANLSGKQTGKVGWLEIVCEGNKESMMKKTTPYEMQLNPASRILIFTDGVRDFMAGKTPVEKRVEEIKKALIYSPSIVDCISRINLSASQELAYQGGKLSDDYTIIGLEIK